MCPRENNFGELYKWVFLGGYNCSNLVLGWISCIALLNKPKYGKLVGAEYVTTGKNALSTEK